MFTLVLIVGIGITQCLNNRSYDRAIKEQQRSIWCLVERIQILERAAIPRPAARVKFYVNLAGVKTKVSQMNLKVSQSIGVSAVFVDKFNNPTNVDGAPVWSLTNPSLGNVVAAEDGMSATVTPTGVLGDAELHALGDAKEGEEVKQILGVLPISFISGEATIVQMIAGTPTDV